jgi:hypothetical protein
MQKAINIGNSLIASFVINNWDHIAVVYGKRVIAFLGRWVWEINLTSKRGILTFAENLLPTVLFLTGTVAAIMNGVFRRASIVWLMIIVAFVFCIIFFIDGMYRYRTPAIPFIAIAVAYGSDRAIHVVMIIAKQLTGNLLRKRRMGKHERRVIQRKSLPQQDKIG